MNDDQPPLWIKEAEIVEMFGMREAVDALERALLMEAAAEARNMPKTHVAWGGGDTLHAIGAVMVGAGIVGTKTWAHTEGGATPLVVLYDAENGRLLAIVEAFAMGQLRTGAMSGLATRALAASDADDLAMIGTGKQALPQVAAVAAVRPLRRVRVFAPTSAHREAFAERLRERFSFEVVVSETLEDAVEGASILTLCTRATEPFITEAMPARGAHINAVGAIVPSRMEFTPDLFERCGAIAADSVESVRKLSREFIDGFGNDEAQWNRVLPMSQVLVNGITRDPAWDVSLFKAMGMGISDLALGVEALQVARERGLGRPLEHPRKVQPNFGQSAQVR